MRKILIVLLLLGIVFSSVTIEASGVFIDAGSAVLIEKNSKRILYQKDCHEQFLTASIVKIMTAIIVIENSDVYEYVEVTKKATLQIGSSIYLESGDKLKVIDLLYGMLLRSGNDAAFLLSQAVTLSPVEFSNLMNDKAKELKMTSSVFTNPTGLDDETQNYSTAYDMALLMAYCLDNEIFREIISTKSYSTTSYNGKKYTFFNKHKLVNSIDYVTGGKTGYTTKAKRTLVTSAKKNGMELIAVTFKCSDDWNSHIKLFDFGFSNYSLKTVLDEGIIVVDDDLYNITPYNPFKISYPLKDDEYIYVIVYLLKNPKNERIIGEAKLYLDGQIVISTLIYRYY